MNGQFIVYLIEDEEVLKAMWEHSKSTAISSLELYVEEVALGNHNVNTLETQQVLNVTLSTPFDMPMPFDPRLGLNMVWSKP